MKKQKIILVLLTLSAMPMAFAVAPVVDYSTDISSGSTPTPTAPTISVDNDSNAASTMSVTPIPSEQAVEGTVNAGPANNPSVYPTLDTSNMSTAQRINRLEQQVNYFNNLNANLNDVRQKLQKMQGDLELQQHKTEQLEKQLNDFYADLDQRIDKTKSKSTTTSSSKESSAKKTTKVAKNVSSDLKVTDKVANNSVATASSAAAVPAKKTVVKKESSMEEQQAYKSAFDSLQNRQYDVAVKKLKTYLSSYPDGTYAGNAHYWLGELYFQGNAYAKASTEFDHVVSKYLGSSKVPDAMFKLAYIHDKEGKHKQARSEYRELKKRFPKSGAAKLAEEQLSLKN